MEWAATMWRSQMFWRLALAYTFLPLAAVVLLGIAVLNRVERHFLDQTEGELNAKAALVREAIRDVPAHDAAALQRRVEGLRASANARVTVLAADGRILADSDEEPALMENHAARPEIQQARESGSGTTTRYSRTLHLPMMYLAQAADGAGGVGFVRVALPLERVRDDLAGLRAIVGIAALLTGLVATGMAFTLARRVTRPLRDLAAAAGHIAAGGFGRTVNAVGPGEVADLARTFNHMSGRLAEQFGELRRLERIRQEFAANASHELKTPLSVIKAAAETLLEGAGDDPIHRQLFLEQIATQADRLHALILDLLSLARIEARAETFEPMEVRLGAEVAACVERHRAKAGAKSQTLEAEPPTGGDVAAWADAEAVEQVLDNLVDNALKYTPAGGRVRVRWGADSRSAFLAVEDTGIGIPAADLPRVFERFYRVDKARSRELGGTGLGLSIVKHLAQAMGGEVAAESRVGAGSTFTVRLPREQTSPILHAAAATAS